MVFRKRKVVVGISGGVDSAVTALLLKTQGYEVSGLYFSVSPILSEVAEKLERISKILQIPIKILDVQKEFKATVIEYFRKEHLAGRSPSPCTICNPEFKWKVLFDYAQQKGAELVASGHYIQKAVIDNKWFIVRGEDDKKDQSYYLWGIKQDYLQRMIFPLGNQTKDITKEIAYKNGLDFVVKSKESTGLCFAEGLPYSSLIKKHIPETALIPEGSIVDETGKEIGKHNGYIYYTIGQKRDLNFYESTDKCVVAIDASKNQLIAGLPSELWHNTFTVTDCVFADIASVLMSKTISVKIRGFGWNPDGYCTLAEKGNNTFTVTLENNAWAPAPGQPAVFYSGNILVGGGIIQ